MHKEEEELDLFSQSSATLMLNDMKSSQQNNQPSEAWSSQYTHSKAAMAPPVGCNQPDKVRQSKDYSFI